MKLSPPTPYERNRDSPPKTDDQLMANLEQLELLRITRFNGFDRIVRAFDGDRPIG